MSNPRWGTAKKFKVQLKRNANAQEEREQQERVAVEQRRRWRNVGAYERGQSESDKQRWGTEKKFPSQLKKEKNAKEAWSALLQSWRDERQRREAENKVKYQAREAAWPGRPLIKHGPRGEVYTLRNNGEYNYVPFSGNSRNTYWVPRNMTSRRQGNIYDGPPPREREYGVAVPNSPPPPPPPPPPPGIMTMANEYDPNAPPLTLIPEPRVAASRKNRKNRKTRNNRRRNRTRRNRR